MDCQIFKRCLECQQGIKIAKILKPKIPESKWPPKRHFEEPDQEIQNGFEGAITKKEVDEHFFWHVLTVTLIMHLQN